MKYILFFLVVFIISWNVNVNRTEEVKLQPPYKAERLSAIPKPDPVDHDSPEWLKEIYK